MRYALSGIVILLYMLPLNSFSQEQSGTADRVINFPSKFFSRIQGKTANLDKQLTEQTDKYLAKMAKREERLKKKLYKIDSTAAKNLFANSAQQYAALAQKLKTDTGSRTQSLSGEYQPYTDSLQGTLSFLQQNPSASSLSPKMSAELQSSASQLQALQAKMQDADQVKAYIQQRKQQIGQYISQHASLAGILGKQYDGLKQDQFYYCQQVQQYKDMLNNPDQLEQKALSLLSQLPVFQNFMKNNSQLAGLFNLPANYGSPQGLVGLQTRDQVNALIQGQVAAGGAGGAAALQSNLQSAESQLDGFKDKLSKLGSGSGDIDMPDFKPNDQKTKTFWKRLEYGTNFQTTRSSYFYPTVLDLGLSVGYRVSNSLTAGLGGAFKLGTGNGIQHIVFSGQGASIRSFFDVKLKGNLFASGGFEYNYEQPFANYQQINSLSLWQSSGLAGISKIVSVKSKAFKKTKISLLWDFLSYSQIPHSQPFKFRIGYGF
ncbi:MAG TPA: hypothetical protein VNS58_00850 [Puia sp.]|nr:hypothetical protein [Puia sp.]